jgi:hypothetical protein
MRKLRRSDKQDVNWATRMVCHNDNFIVYFSGFWRPNLPLALEE